MLSHDYQRRSQRARISVVERADHHSPVHWAALPLGQAFAFTSIVDLASAQSMANTKSAWIPVLGRRPNAMQFWASGACPQVSRRNAH
jgi:hypothetical protein